MERAVQDRQMHNDEANKIENAVTPYMIDKGCEVISRFFCFQLDDPEIIAAISQYMVL